VVPVRSGSATDWKVRRTCTPSSGRQDTCRPMPCQSASKRRCGFSSRARPERPLHGRSFRKGVRFSVQTCSDGKDAWRSACGRVCGHAGRAPSGVKARVGEVVRCSSREARDAQKRPASALRRSRHRASTPCRPGPCVAGPPSAIHAHRAAPVATSGSSGYPQRS
jgi:hypothetical protein